MRSIQDAMSELDHVEGVHAREYELEIVLERAEEAVPEVWGG